MTQLPHGWVDAAIEDCLCSLDDGRLIHQGWSPQCERVPADDVDAWGVLKTTAIQPGAFIAEENKKLPHAMEPRSGIEVRPGDLLLTCAGPRARCGVACLVRDTRPRLMLSGKMYRFRVNERDIDPRFVEAALLSPALVDALDEIKTGISDSGLNLTHSRFRALRIPVAPRPEQERIIAAIEEASSKLDAGEAGLRIVRQLLNRLRDAILAAAVAGRLVPQNAMDTPASNLLAHLGIEPVDRDDLPNLPEGWAWAAIEGVAARMPNALAIGPFGSNLKVTDYADNGVPLVFVRNIRRRDFRTALKHVTHEKANELASHSVRERDVLITKMGDPPGDTAVYTESRAAIITADCIKVTCGAGVTPEYLSLAIAGGHTRRLLHEATRGVAQKKVSLGRFRVLPVPIPPLEEQARITAEVDRQMSFVDACERAVDDGLKRSVALRKSVLKAAFEGRLVPQDRTDEPASVLLERIRAEREATLEPSGPGRERRHE